MAQFPALPLWTDAYLADTKHLTTLEHGAYLLLLIAMWRAGGALPNDDRKLARFAGVQTNQWGRIKPTMMEFMRVSADGLTISQGRLSDELQYVRDHAKKQAGNARSRWQKDTAPPEPVEQHPSDPLNSEAGNPLENNDKGDATASFWQCQTDAPTPTPTPTIDTPNGVFPETGVSGSPPKKATPRKRNSYPAEFDSAWAAYPTSPNMSKSEAFKAWSKLDDEDRAALLKAIPSFTAHCKANPDYQPVYFDRFIRQRRFDGFAASSALERQVNEADWRKRLNYARDTRKWDEANWGPAPHRPGSRVPLELIRDSDGLGWLCPVAA